MRECNVLVYADDKIRVYVQLPLLDDGRDNEWLTPEQLDLLEAIRSTLRKLYNTTT